MGLFSKFIALPIRPSTNKSAPGAATVSTPSFDARDESATATPWVADSSLASNDGVLTVAAPGADLLVDGRIGKAINFENNPINYVALERKWDAIPNTFAAWVKVPTNIP